MVSEKERKLDMVEEIMAVDKTCPYSELKDLSLDEMERKLRAVMKANIPEYFHSCSCCSEDYRASTVRGLCPMCVNVSIIGYDYDETAGKPLSDEDIKGRDFSGRLPDKTSANGCEPMTEKTQNVSEIVDSENPQFRVVSVHKDGTETDIPNSEKQETLRMAIHDESVVAILWQSPNLTVTVDLSNDFRRNAFDNACDYMFKTDNDIEVTRMVWSASKLPSVAKIGKRTQIGTATVPDWTVRSYTSDDKAMKKIGIYTSDFMVVRQGSGRATKAEQDDSYAFWQNVAEEAMADAPFEGYENKPNKTGTTMKAKTGEKKKIVAGRKARAIKSYFQAKQIVDWTGESINDYFLDDGRKADLPELAVKYPWLYGQRAREVMGESPIEPNVSGMLNELTASPEERELIETAVLLLDEERRCRHMEIREMLNPDFTAHSKFDLSEFLNAITPMSSLSTQVTPSELEALKLEQWADEADETVRASEQNYAQMN